MHALIQGVILGILTGGVYALMASGQTLIFGIMKVVNLAQGAMVIMAAFLSYQLFTTFGVAAITTPAGSASLKVRLVRAGEPAGLETVNVSVLGWPTPIVVGANALASDGTGCTVSDEDVTLFVTRAVAPMLAALFV